MKSQAVLSLSGGMDSSTLLLNLLTNEFEVLAISFDYGQKHNIELKRAKELISYLANYGHIVKHEIIKLDGLQGLLHSNLVKGGDDVPEGHYEDDNMKKTVVPNRNKIMNSIIQAVALSLAINKNSTVKIASGIHAGDHAIYPDCRRNFRDLDFLAFKAGNWESEKVSLYTPYIRLDKYKILKDGLICCGKDFLNISFDEVYKRTNTSYKPTKEGYSDYKSASSVERIEAFIKLGRPDPVTYADESGIVSWDIVKQHTEEVLNNV